MILATHRRGDGSVLAENVLAENPRAGSQALWLNLVLTAHSTLRGASAVWNVLREFVPGWPEAPDWTTGRTWLLRLGCDPLRRPQERATDGIWFLDHTVQIGPQKVLLILGIRASRLPVDRPLQLADLEPVALVPTERADTAHVYQALQRATAETGVPTAILSDHGAELVSGIARFRQDHPRTRAWYDLKHKAAGLLQRRLEADPRFAEYSRQRGQCQFQVSQTERDFLVPPSGRRKARFMNREQFVGWGRRTLQVLEHPSPVVCQHASHERLEHKLGWLRDHREAFSENRMDLVADDDRHRAARRPLRHHVRDAPAPGHPTAEIPTGLHRATAVRPAGVRVRRGRTTDGRRTAAPADRGAGVLLRPVEISGRGPTTARLQRAAAEPGSLGGNLDTAANRQRPGPHSRESDQPLGANPPRPHPSHPTPPRLRGYQIAKQIPEEHNRPSRPSFHQPTLTLRFSTGS